MWQRKCWIRNLRVTGRTWDRSLGCDSDNTNSQHAPVFLLWLTKKQMKNQHNEDKHYGCVQVFLAISQSVRRRFDRATIHHVGLLNCYFCNILVRARTAITLSDSLGFAHMSHRWRVRKCVLKGSKVRINPHVMPLAAAHSSAAQGDKLWSPLPPTKLWQRATQKCRTGF